MSCWDIAAAKVKKTWELPDAGAFHAVSPDGKYLFTVEKTSKKLLQVRELDSGRHFATLDTSPQEAPLRAAVFTPDNKLLVTASDSGAIKLWGMSTFKEKASFQCGNPPLGAITMCISPDGKKLGTKDWGNKSKALLWDLTATPVTGRQLEPRGVPFAFSPDGKFMVTHSTLPLDDWASKEAIKEADLGRVDLWDVQMGKVVKCLVNSKLKRIDPFLPYTMQFSPDGQTLAIYWENVVELVRVAGFTAPKFSKK